MASPNVSIAPNTRKPSAMDFLNMAAQQTNKVKAGAVVTPKAQQQQKVAQNAAAMFQNPLGLTNLYGSKAPLGSVQGAQELMKMKPQEVKQKTSDKYGQVRDDTIRGVMNKMDTGEPVTVQELRLMAEGANEDDLWDAIDTAMAEGARFEGLNYEKPVDTSPNVLKDSLTQAALGLVNPLQGLTALSGIKRAIPSFGEVPGFNAVEGAAQGLSSGVVKGIQGIAQGGIDLANLIGQKTNQYNPLISDETRQSNADTLQGNTDDISSLINRQAEGAIGRTQRGISEGATEGLPYQIAQEVGKIGVTAAATAPLGGAGLLGKAPLLARVAMGAAEGLAGNALYNKASGGEYGDNATTAGVIGGAIPLAGAAIKGAGRLLNIGKDAKTSAIIKAISEPVNNKNAVNALREGRLTTYGKGGIGETLFGAKGATIDMSKKIALASDDILKNIPKPSSKPEVLYTQIGDRVSQLGSDMSNSLKNVDVSGMKGAKNAIVKNINSEFVNNPAVKEILGPSRAKQYVSLMQNIKNAKNADELWQARKTFDMMTPNSIKEINMATASSKDKAIYEAWMGARSLINDTLDNIPFTDANVKENFRTMSSLYNAQGNIEQNIIKKIRDKLGPLSVSSIASKALPRLGAGAAGSAAYALKN